MCFYGNSSLPPGAYASYIVGVGVGVGVAVGVGVGRRGRGGHVGSGVVAVWRNICVKY
jgi:hypothetical protein